MPLSSLKKTASIRGIVGIWRKAVDLLLSDPRILIPFLVLAAAETLALWLLSVSPHFPFNYVLAPPIKSIWGAVYLHYPYIYVLLPKVYYYGKLAADILVGALTGATAVYLVARLQHREKVRIGSAFRAVLKHYVSLFLLSLVLYVGVHFLMKEPTLLLLKYFRGHAKLLFLPARFWLTMFVPAVNFVLAVMVQGFFIYAIPYIVLKEKKFLAAFLAGARLFLRNFGRTLLLVAVPMCLYIPISMLRSNLPFLQDKFSPEIAVPVLFSGVVIGTFLVDSLVTVATTLLFLEKADEK